MAAVDLNKDNFDEIVSSNNFVIIESGEGTGPGELMGVTDVCIDEYTDHGH